MSEEAAFLDAIRANPDDDTARLVYADFLQENGEDERAEFIRVQCALAHLPESDECRHGLGMCGPKLKCPGCDLRRREAQLLEAHWHRHLGRERLLQWQLARGGLNRFDAHLPGSPRIEFSVSFVRGFWGRVTCGAAVWLDHGDAICAAHPVTKVVLTTAPTYDQLQSHKGRVLVVTDYERHKSVIMSLCLTLWPGVGFDLPSGESQPAHPYGTCGRFAIDRALAHGERPVDPGDEGHVL